MRDRELVDGASISRVEVVERSTTYGSNTYVDATKGVPTEGVGFGKWNPPAFLSFVLRTSGLLHLLPFIYYLEHWARFHVFCCRWSK